MNKRIWFMASGAIALGVVLLASFSSDVAVHVSEQQNRAGSTTSAVSAPSRMADPREDDDLVAINAPLERQQGELARQQWTDQQLAEAWLQQLAEPGNQQQWIQQFWQACRAHDCDVALADLAPWLSAEQLAVLRQDVRNFGLYHEQMSNLVMSTELTPQQRYEQVSYLRHRQFGEAAERLFGHEDAFAYYQFAYDQLFQYDRRSLTPEQRLQAVTALREQRLSELGANRDELLGAMQAYQQDLLLLNDLSADERAYWQARLREQYFPNQSAEVAAHEQRLAQLADQQQRYQNALAALKSEMDALADTLPAEVWQQRYQQQLRELRATIFTPIVVN